MALVVGLFGGVLLLVRRQILKTLSATHDTVQRIPLPTPTALVHLAAFGALFYAYAWFWGLDAQVLAAARDGMSQAWAAVR